MFRYSHKAVPSIHPLSQCNSLHPSFLHGGRGASTITEGTVYPKGNCGIRANKCVNTYRPFQSQAFSNKLFHYTPSTNLWSGCCSHCTDKKNLIEVKWPDRMEDPSFTDLVFQLQFQCYLSALWLILPEISIRDKTEETLIEGLQRSEVINLTY